MVRGLSWLTPVESVGRNVYRVLEDLGRTLLFLGEAMSALVRGRVRWSVLMEQMLQIGVRSTFVIVLTGTFTGLVFALQTSYAFGLFSAEALIGPSVVLSLTRELGPVLGGLMVTGRAGSAMATELGTMRVTEQIDALDAMAVSPMEYLVLPRLLAATLMLPLLVALFDFVGFLGAYAISVYVVDVGPYEFTSRIITAVDLKDLYSGIFKAGVFGLLISLICTSRGYFATGGARGVGIATTEAVVLSSVVILIADYFLTALFFG